MLSGICPEAVELFKEKHIPTSTFRTLRRMAPLRQIEAAELMISMNNYSNGYATSLLARTPQQLLESDKPKKIKGLTERQMELMERKSASLDREFKMVEQSYGNDHLDLVLTIGYLRKLIGNPKVARYLAQKNTKRSYLSSASWPIPSGCSLRTALCSDSSH